MQNSAIPTVSVLVAARNEEKQILQCLQSLARLKYPPEKIEILIGNDGSTDATAAIVKDFISGKTNFRLIEINGTTGNARGKANVLAQLARQAKGQYFLITDADVEVPPNWVQGHLKHFTGDVYITSGSTIAHGKSFWARLQGLEWAYLMGLFNVFDALKSITAMGNNMAVSAEAYFKTGGYENIPFSVTEDVQLMREMQKLNLKHKHILSAEVLAFTTATAGLNQLLAQRQRWYAGGKKQPLHIWLLYLIYALFLPAWLLLLFIEPKTAIYTIAGKCLLDGILLFSIYRILRLPMRGLFLLLPFEFYLLIINPLLLFYALIINKVKWKGRQY